MIGSHCGARVLFFPKDYTNDKFFRVKCRVCGKVFKQKKRQPKKKEQTWKGSKH